MSYTIDELTNYLLWIMIFIGLVICIAFSMTYIITSTSQNLPLWVDIGVKYFGNGIVK